MRYFNLLRFTSTAMVIAAFAAAVVWLAVCCRPADAAAPFFMGLGDLAGGGFSSFAYGISADGSVVVGQGLSASGAEAFRWTQDDGMVGLSALPGGDFGSIAFSASADGSVIVGESGVLLPPPLNFGRLDAFRWTHGGGMEALPGYTYGSSAAGVSADGSVVVGTGTTFPGGTRPDRPPETEAFRWSQVGGLVRLGDLPGGLMRGSATSISADGSVIVGFGSSASGTQAFRWTEDGGMVGLGDLAGGGFSSLANDVSADGSVIVGHSSSVSGSEAFRWTQGGGMVGLGDLPDGLFLSNADGVSADGSVVVGWSHSASGTEAFIWDATHGIRSLRDVLANDFGLGASLAGWKLEYARGISADGQVVVGYGINPNGDREAWITRLAPPTPFPGDFNHNGTVDAADYVVWRKNGGQQNEYETWRAHFGQTASSGSGATGSASVAVPEPSTLALIILAIPFHFWWPKMLSRHMYI